MLLLATLAILISSRSRDAHSIWIIQCLAAFGLYRGVDVLINLARTGVFFSFRGDVLISDEPVWRLRRILIGIFMNYTELMLWYAIVYYYLSIVNDKSFSNPIVSIWAALNVSISTMTGGFGYVNGVWATGIVPFVVFVIAGTAAQNPVALLMPRPRAISTSRYVSMRVWCGSSWPHAKGVAPRYAP